MQLFQKNRSFFKGLSLPYIVGGLLEMAKAQHSTQPIGKGGCWATIFDDMSARERIEQALMPQIEAGLNEQAVQSTNHRA
jgi:hypothetical protein